MNRPAALLLAAAALAGLAGLAGCRDGTEEAAAPLRPVLVGTVAIEDHDSFGPFASTVEARYRTPLGFQLAGRMVARDVYVGDMVRKGQRLAALDPAVTRFALTRAEADVVNAQALLDNAAGIETRQRALVEGGNASQAVLDNAVAGLDTAKARLDQAQAAKRMAETALGYTELRANVDGVVTAWSAEVGQYVDTGQAVVTLARPDVREAVVDIPDELIGRVGPGMSFAARLEAAPAVTARASVREIGPLADEVTRTHRVRLALEDAPPAFRLGTVLAVTHEVAVAPFARVPASAVLRDGDRTSVWLLAADGRHVTRRAVTLAAPDPLADRDGEARVASGLRDGDRVVVVGVHSLAEGQEVAGAVAAIPGAAPAAATTVPTTVATAAATTGGSRP